MNRLLVVGPLSLVITAAFFTALDGCSSTPDMPAVDAGPEVVRDSGSGSDAAPMPDAGCSATDPDASVTTVDAGAPLTIFDVGGLDLRLGMSADGTTALVEDITTGDVFFYDTVKGTIARKTHVDGDPSTVSATSLSGDGRRIGATHGATDIVGGVWDGCSGAWSDLENPNAMGCAGPPNEQSGVFGLNVDGTIAVGNAWNGCATSPMRWTAAGGAWTPTVLDQLGMAGGSDRASAVSADGTLIGGFAQVPMADRSPAIWTSAGKGTLLDPSGTVVGEVLVVSADGTMVAGPWNGVTDAGTADNDGFYWTAKDGVRLIGTLPNPQAQDMVWPVAIAAGNELIFGSAGDPSWWADLAGTEEFAVVWTEASGMRKLQDVVNAQNIAIPDGYDLTGVSAASADGTVILGFATDMNDPLLAQHTFVLRMPVSAYGL